MALAFWLMASVAVVPRQVLEISSCNLGCSHSWGAQRYNFTDVEVVETNSTTNPTLGGNSDPHSVQPRSLVLRYSRWLDPVTLDELPLAAVIVLASPFTNAIRQDMEVLVSASSGDVLSINGCDCTTGACSMIGCVAPAVRYYRTTFLSDGIYSCDPFTECGCFPALCETTLLPTPVSSSTISSPAASVVLSSTTTTLLSSTTTVGASSTLPNRSTVSAGSSTISASPYDGWPPSNVTTTTSRTRVIAALAPSSSKAGATTGAVAGLVVAAVVAVIIGVAIRKAKTNNTNPNSNPEFDEVTPGGTLTFCANVNHPSGVTRAQYLQPASVAGLYNMASNNIADESLPHIYEVVDDLMTPHADAQGPNSDGDFSESADNTCFYDPATMSMPNIEAENMENDEPLMVSNPLYGTKTETE